MFAKLKGFKKVFSFSFVQHVKRKSFLTLLAVIALLCLVAPAMIMGLMEKKSENKEDTSQVVETQIKTVAVVDTDQEHQVDYNLLNQVGDSIFSNLVYEEAKSLENVPEMGEYGLILYVEKVENTYNLEVLIPDGSVIEESEASNYESFLNQAFHYVLMAKSGLTEEQMQAIQQEVPVQVEELQATSTDENQDPFAGIREILSYMIPYATIMVLYFMILAYGQGIANNIVQEKSSKLMDNLLVSVSPEALVMGKVVALFCSGVMQTFIWVISLIVGLVIGVQVVHQINPESNMLLLQFFKALDMYSGIFNFTGILFALLIFLAGFLLYCALASLGGSLASKQEELGSANVIFTMALVISFLAAIYYGGLNSGQPAIWMMYVPFTAVLVAPGQALLGQLSLVQSLISLGILLVTDFIVITIAGKIYHSTVLYRGAPLTVNKIIKILKS